MKYFEFCTVPGNVPHDISEDRSFFTHLMNLPMVYEVKFLECMPVTVKLFT